MQARELTKGVHWVGVVDWDRRLFDELIELPDGTSYNAYLVRGREKTALIDTVDPKFTDVLLQRLEALHVDRIDYLVANHAEQDHSGSLPVLAERFPMATILSTPKAKGMLADLLPLAAERFTPVEDGAGVELGGKTLRFVHFPWVHWPETMLTYLEEDRILFSCDLFGSHLAASELFADGRPELLADAKRYYATIMMPFGSAIAKNLPKVHTLDPAMIAPSHGPVYAEPRTILESYGRWTGGPLANRAVIAYISMHESTRLMVRHLDDALASRGVSVEQHDLTAPDLGKLGMALVDAGTIVLGSPFVLAGAHPKAAYAAIVANALKPRVRYAAVIGSYGWGGKMAEQLASLLFSLKVEMLEPVLARGLPRAPDLAALDRLAASIAEKHAAMGSTSVARESALATP